VDQVSRSVLEALNPSRAEYGTLQGFSPMVFHITHWGRFLSSPGMYSDLTGSMFFPVALCSFVYNAITPSARGRGRNWDGPADRFL
jgi:hypothetical protein